VLLVVALLVGGLAACGDNNSGGGTAPSAPGAASATAATACTATSVEERLDVRYAGAAGVDPAVQSLDLYLPEGCEDAPLVVWVHGGAFAHGDKRHRVADKVDWFTGRGWAFAFNTAYRNDIAGRLDGLPTDVGDGAQEAPAIALGAAGGMGADGAQLVASAQHAFESGLRAAVLLSAALFAFGALYTWWRGEDAVPAGASDDDLAGAVEPSTVEVVPEPA
jgi:hypothetical protein